MSNHPQLTKGIIETKVQRNPPNDAASNEKQSIWFSKPMNLQRYRSRRDVNHKKYKRKKAQTRKYQEEKSINNNRLPIGKGVTISNYY
jgi:hypothetical protein